jgi:Cof subfamily protein (haloacid dehalogenase superfamily)
MKKIFFFDLDGTILDPQTNSIPNSTINALQRLKENGHFCAVATGRTMKSILRAKLNEIILWDGFVCSNGQQVFLSTDKPLYQQYMDPKTVYALEAYAQKHGINIQYESHPSFLLKKEDEAVKISHSFFNEPIPTLYKTYNNENIDMMLAYTHDRHHFDEIAKIPGISVYPGEAPYADVIDASFSKYHGIKALLEHYNMDHTSYIAFGDSLNDEEMITHAKISIAMGNANPKLKEIADVITRSVDQDGIYTACQIYHWI